MIHALLVIAAVLFVLWLLFHAAGAMVNLIWIAIALLVVFWIVGLLRGRSTTQLRRYCGAGLVLAPQPKSAYWRLAI